MRTAYLADRRRLEVREREPLEVEDDEVLLDVRACGICASNLHNWRHPELVIEAGGTGAGAVGHEVTGEVVAVGSDVGHIEPGDLVVVEPNLASACGACHACRAGSAWFCRDRDPIDVWGFAEQMTVPAKSLYPVPAGLGPEVASLAEPLACAVHAVRHSWSGRHAGRIDGRTVAVVGAGVTGLLAVAATRHLGAARIDVLARYDQQAELAERLGATTVVRDGEPDALERLGSARPDFVVEAVGGTADTFDAALQVVDRGGEVVVLGLFDEPQSLDARRAVFSELRLFFAVTYAELDGTHDFEVALGILESRQVALEGLISHRFPLEQVGQAFETAADKHSGALRVVVGPDL